MASSTLWLAVSIKRGERDIVETEPHKTFMDLLEEVMVRNTSELPPFDVENVRHFSF